MLVIWRGYGWVLPLVVFLAFLASQVVVDLFQGDGYYSSHEWPKAMAVAFSAVVAAAMGYFLNYRFRKVVVNEETGEVVGKSPSHSLFFVPVQYWAVIIPLLAFWVYQSELESDKRQAELVAGPEINDVYMVDYTKIFDEFDKTYKYGAMKVVDVGEAVVKVSLSEMSYNMRSGPREDYRDGKTADADYFVPDLFEIDREMLASLVEEDVIYDVYR